MMLNIYGTNKIQSFHTFEVFILFQTIKQSTSSFCPGLLNQAVVRLFNIMMENTCSKLEKK